MWILFSVINLFVSLLFPKRERKKRRKPLSLSAITKHAAFYFVYSIACRAHKSFDYRHINMETIVKLEGIYS